MKTGMAIVLAIIASPLLNLAIYLQKKAVVKLPEVKLRLSWDTVKTFITNKPWITAQVVNITGFALYAVALAFASVSILETLVAPAVALLAYLAIKHLGKGPARST